MIFYSFITLPGYLFGMMVWIWRYNYKTTPLHLRKSAHLALLSVCIVLIWFDHLKKSAYLVCSWKKSAHMVCSFEVKKYAHLYQWISFINSNGKLKIVFLPKLFSHECSFFYFWRALLLFSRVLFSRVLMIFYLESTDLVCRIIEYRISHNLCGSLI